MQRQKHVRSFEKGNEVLPVCTLQKVPRKLFADLRKKCLF